MITLQDCLDMSGLSADLVNAIAEHEHLPSIVAMELGENLLANPEGRAVIERYLDEDLAAAWRSGDRHRIARVQRAIDCFAALDGTQSRG